MFVLDIGFSQMTYNLANTFCIWTTSRHAQLCLAHLADRHFFHGASNLLRIFDARNFSANLFCACHLTPFRLAGGDLAIPAANYQLCVALNFSIPSLIAASTSLVKAASLFMVAIKSASSRLKKSSKAASNAPTFSTSTSSR